MGHFYAEIFQLLTIIITSEQEEPFCTFANMAMFKRGE